MRRALLVPEAHSGESLRATALCFNELEHSPHSKGNGCQPQGYDTSGRTKAELSRKEVGDGLQRRILPGNHDRGA